MLNKVLHFDGRLDNRSDLLPRFSLNGDAGNAAIARATYERWGAAGFVHLIGDWSLVIRDHANRMTVLASDFAGVSTPLTWDEVDECDPRDFTLATIPSRYAAVGDRHDAIDAHACSLDGLLELSARQEREGLGDAPWPPHYRKQSGEPRRVAPSRARADAGSPVARASGRRTPTRPLIEIGRARKKRDALEGCERWKARHPDAAAHLEPADVLVDAMRGRFQTWSRIRLNLQHVPEALRPAQEALDPNDEPDDWGDVMSRGGLRRSPSRARQAE